MQPQGTLSMGTREEAWHHLQLIFSGGSHQTPHVLMQQPWPCSQNQRTSHSMH